MRADQLLIRVYAEQEGKQWSLVTLDFGLAAQAETFAEAKNLLEIQIREYLQDALVGQDREYAEQLLSRRAPAVYWIKYYLVRFLGKFSSGGGPKAFKKSMSLTPA